MKYIVEQKVVHVVEAESLEDAYVKAAEALGEGPFEIESDYAYPDPDSEEQS